MYTYHLMEWLLFFYAYCFLGWVWESCLVSVSEKKWVNRGFLHGPLLPIYGSGASIVLLATIPVRENLILVFIFGMTAATLLEYVTGSAMERMFHVRYWDYSHLPFNVNGHICLLASVGWGFFSILMIRFLHRPVETLVYLLPVEIREILVTCLTAGFAIDATQSFNEAMDLREILANLTENREEFKKIQKRLDVIVAVLDDETKGLRVKMSEGKEALGEAIEEKLAAGERKREERAQERQERVEAREATRRARVEAALERKRTAGNGAIQAVYEKIRKSMEQMSRMAEVREEEDASFDAESMKGELEGFLKRLTGLEKRMDKRRVKEYLRSVKILGRNPSATSKKYKDVLEEIRKLEEK